MQAQFLSRKTKGRDYVEYIGKDVNVRLKCILKELTCVCVCELDSFGSGQGLWLDVMNTVMKLWES
jgi:hypothetical protein